MFGSRAVTIAAMTAPEPAADPFRRAVDGVLAGEQLTQRHWQVLHALAFGAMDALDLRDVLAPFGGPVDVSAVLADLSARGWVSGDGAGRMTHTAAGRAADHGLFDRISALRRGLTAAIERPAGEVRAPSGRRSRPA
ncbi:MAG: hypothetical protein JWR70_239 [Modestobacter sp.]|nr:hypothetical protein [Modestobacter sp.]